MIYTVGWKKPARDALADIWLNAPDRGAVSAAANEIDRELRTDAHRKGVVSRRGRRIFGIAPLTVIFRVDPGDCTVIVLKVRRTK